MKHIYLYIVCLFALLVQTGCKDEEALSTQEGKRTVTVNLGIAMSRVALEGDPETTYGPADDMKVWIFDEEGNPLAYAEKENPPFSIEDVQGNLVESVTMDFEITGAKTLYLRVLLNTDNVMLGNNLTLGADTEMSEIDNATFTFKSDVALGDNKVPMYGKKSITIDNKKNYDIDVAVTRAVGKLELFFTRESANFTLGIKKVTLTKIPDKGYLVEPETYNLSYSDEEETLFSSTNSTGSDISAVLTNNDAILGNFSQYQDDETKLQSLFSAYLLENPNGGKWAGTEDDGNLDYTYPENITSVSDDRYKMTVSYQVSGSDKSQEVYLPAIKRNEWNKIFVRVKDDGRLEIKYKAMPWQKVTSEIGYAPKPAPTTNNPFDTKAEYNEFLSDGYYILLPMDEFKNGKIDNVPEFYWDRTSVQKLFRLLYDYPADRGDDDARYCILTKPTYNLNDDSHKTLKTGTAGARYFFMLTGPTGATWEAKLLNEDGTESEDFVFSYSDEEDFKGSEYESDGKVNKVSHGIARIKPYIIQVNCVNAWTEGTSFTENTEWGEQNERDERIVQTRLYITVTLADGVTYNLDINPSYENSNLEFLYKYEGKNRRYAGEDDFIWIRQVPAQSGWSYERLANTEDSNQYWWKVNPYWK